MMRGRASWTLPAAVVGALLCGLLPTASAAPIDVSPVDCLGPVEGELEPGSPEWTVRDLQNLYCSQERRNDRAQHPAAALALDDSQPDPGIMSSRDAYRMPFRHDGTRFRYHPDTVTNRAGAAVAVEVYRPCAEGACDDLPEGLETHEPPYPVVVVVPGGGGVPGAPEETSEPGAPKELYRWVAQGLAESGYMTVILRITTEHITDAQDVLDWMLASRDQPTHAGEHNPFRDEVDPGHIGIAGHSGGGATASRLGHLDPRFDAIVSYDRSGRYEMPEDDADITTPTLFFVGDYGIQVEPHLEDPDADGTAQTEGFHRLRRLDVDTMHLALRAASHTDWSPPVIVGGNRHVEPVSFYYTLAWFDRYLKGATDPATAADAYERLTATVFDASADVHNISQGRFDPVQAAAAADPYGGNVPYTVAEGSVADALSFYFSSRCFISVPGVGGPAVSDDMRRDGCTHSDSAAPPCPPPVADPSRPGPPWCR